MSFGERRLHKRCWRVAAQVERLEPSVKDLSDKDLRHKVYDLRARLRDDKATLLSVMPEMFAIVREASRRTVDIRQYPLQIAGGAALAFGATMELNTGEGKTYITPLAACLRALEQRGVHVLTANDYLAGRDAELLRPVYELLGFSLGIIVADTAYDERPRALTADITYSTVPQLGYAYLREFFRQDADTLRQEDMWRFLRSDIDGVTREQRCLRGRHFAIMDEIDSILIDYARAPLSLSMQAEIQHPPEIYAISRAFALDSMEEETDFTIEKAKRQLELTDKGKKKAYELQKEYSYYHLLDSEWEDRVREALVIEHLYRQNEHYVIKQGIAVLIDETSGRLMLGQRLGGETHQALEHKEGLKIQPRQTVAKKITIQALLRPYKHLSGLTGTAWESRREFSSVYDMPVVRFAPRLPSQRVFRPDIFFSDPEDRWETVVEDVVREHAKGRPILVGTCTVEKSRHLSDLLEQRGISHDVLNAVDHANEAEIIAGAGQMNAVTVATNMAGRGVEIKLGDGVREVGGMHVIGSERHTTGRVDRQLGGRVGRRGAPGTVQFYVSTEDEVLRALPERRLKMMKRLLERAGGHTTSPTLSKYYSKAQDTFEHYYDMMRRRLLIADMAQEEADKILFGQQNI